MLAGLALLGSCSPAYEEPFLSAYEKLASPAGTVWFVSISKLRNCSWFECGESSHKYLGSSIQALLLQRDETGALKVEQLAQIECGEPRIDDCTFGPLRPQLRFSEHGPVLINSRGRPGKETVAWQDMRGTALGEGIWLCTATALPQAYDARVLKVTPNTDFTAVAQVLYALPRPSQEGEAGRCTDTADLPHRPDSPENLYLADAFRDAAGSLQVVYLAQRSEYDWEGVVTLLAAESGDTWRAEDIGQATREASGHAPYMPTFLDTSAQQLVLGSSNGRAQWQIDVQLLDRENGEARTVRARSGV